MRDLVDRYVKAQTAGLGMGYALKQNMKEPLEVNIMVSHAWDENAADFFEALERSAGEGDALFICALSLYQCEDGAGPSIAEQLGTAAEDSPFRRVLDHIRNRREQAWARRLIHKCLRVASNSAFLAAIVLFYYPIGAERCIPTLDGCALAVRTDSEFHTLVKYPNCWFPRFEFEAGPLDDAFRGWLPATIVLLFLAAVLRFVETVVCRYQGFMLAVPNRECDLYSRLWCVYEIFVANKLAVPVIIAKTLAPAGQCTWERAHCSSEQDSFRIRAEISRWASSGFFKKQDAAARVERAIRRVTRSSRYRMAMTMLTWAAPFIFMEAAMGVSHLRELGEPRFPMQDVCDGFLSIAVGGALVMGVAFQIARAKQGVLNRKVCLIASATFFSAGLAFHMIDVAFQRHGYPHAAHWPIPFHHCFIITIIWGGISLAVLSELHCLLHVPLRLRVFLVGAFVVGCIVFYAWWGSAAHGRRGQAYPLIVWFISFRAAPMLGVPCVLLFSAEMWGIRFEGEPFWRSKWCCGRCCRRRKLRRSDSECTECFALSIPGIDV